MIIIIIIVIIIIILIIMIIIINYDWILTTKKYLSLLQAQSWFSYDVLFGKKIAKGVI